MCQPGYTPVGLTPDDHQGEHNISLDDENEDHGGDFPNIPYRPAPIPPQPPAQYYPPAPLSPPHGWTPSPKGKGRALSPLGLSPKSVDKDPFGFAPVPDDEDMYMSRPMTPQVPPEPTPPVTPPRTYPIPEPQTPRQSYLDRTYQLQPQAHKEYPLFPPSFPWNAEGTRHLWLAPGIWADGTDERDDWGISQSPTPLPMVELPPLMGVPTPRQHAPDDMNPPRCSGRIGRPVNRPDNVYGNRPPVDILADRENDPFLGNTPRGNQSPGPSGGGSGNNQPMDDPSPSADLVKMAQDGGAELINFLLRAAASSTVAKGKIPDVSKVSEWQYRDLMCLPKAVQEE